MDSEQNKSRPPLQSAALLRERERQLITKLSPAKREEIAGLLARLSLQYSLGQATQNELTMLMEDYANDLAGYPAYALETACKIYRTTKGNEFFPKVWQLIDLASEAVKSDKEELCRVQKWISDETALTHQPQRADPETVDKILKGLYENLSVKPEEKQAFKPYGKAYFEAKASKLSERHTEEATEQPS